MEKTESTDQPKAKRCKLKRSKKRALSVEELSAVRNGDKLTDLHIMAAQNMIKEEFPELDGLETPLLSQVDGFTAITSSGVQIHHVKDHWVTSSCVDNKVSLYDSSPSGKWPVKLTHQLAAVYKLRASTLDDGLQLMVNVPTVQWQKDGTDYGVFAIAFAYHAARGDDPSRITFNQAKMQQHLVACFEEGRLSPFPHSDGPPRQSLKKEVIQRSSCSANA